MCVIIVLHDGLRLHSHIWPLIWKTADTYWLSPPGRPGCGGGRRTAVSVSGCVRFPESAAAAP